MICPNCQHENRPSAKFCGKCRTKLQRVCPGCGAEVVPGNPFCDECSADLSTAAATAASPQLPTLETQFSSFQRDLPQSFREQLLTGAPSPATGPRGWGAEGENRLVTVLFADMSSSVRTTADLHPEDAAALISRLLRAMVDVLLKYEGRVDRFLGDAVLAVFGTPQAHESDPEQAILAAMEIRISARQLGLEVTAGINTGQVYVGGVGSEQHQEVTVIGPVVNLASRLQGQAEPGQILVGEATYRLTRRAFAFTPLSLEVKGIAQPVAAYAVERALPRPQKARGIEGLRAELIGRDAEFAKLRDALAEVIGGRGQVVSLIGEAGVGKSRLVAELKAVAEPSRDREGAESKGEGDREGAESEGERALSDGHGEGAGERALHDGRGSAHASPPLWLERLGEHVNALCSADGEEWLSAGQVEFPVEDAVEVGLHAIGNIDRIVYPGAYPEGTAIRFERFEMWG
jgi:class 3 adenylate cyclase